MTRTTKKFVQFVSRHDESWWFFFIYLAVSFLLSYYFNLGFFCILLVIHLLLDFLKHLHSTNRATNKLRSAFLYTLRDGFLLDFILLLVAFCLGFFVHTTFAVGISRGARIATSQVVFDILDALPRLFAASWIMENVVQVTVYLRDHDKQKVYLPKRVTHIEKVYIIFALVLLVFSLFLPPLFDHSYQELAEYAVRELDPFLFL